MSQLTVRSLISAFSLLSALFLCSDPAVAQSVIRLAQLPAPTRSSEDNQEPKKIELEKGEVVCAKANVISGLTTSFSFPFDFRRGSCWSYSGRSGTGKVKLMVLDEESSLRGYEKNLIDYYRKHPVKIKKDLFEDNFVSNEELDILREAQIASYLEKWPGLSTKQAMKIYEGEPFLAMTTEQATEAVGWLIHRRAKRVTNEGEEEIWELGKRSLAAQTTSELKGSMITDMLVGPSYRIAPPSPTLAAAAQETIGRLLTFVDDRLAAIEDVSLAR